MAHSLLHGAKHALVHGVKHGGLTLGSGGSWTIDGASGWSFPSSATEWSNFIAAKGLSLAIPDSCWLFQEASGNVLDQIGTHHLVAAGTNGAYQTAVPGYTRKGINTINAATFTLTNTDGTLPALNTTSITALVVGLATGNPSAARELMSLGVGTVTQVQVGATSLITVADGANAGGPGAVAITGSVRPYSYTHKPTAVPLARFADDAEKLVPAFSASVTGQKIQIFGGAGLTAPPFTCIYACAWFGAGGEIADANLRSLYAALGATPLW